MDARFLLGFGFAAAYRGASFPAREGTFIAPYHDNTVTRSSHREHSPVRARLPVVTTVTAGASPGGRRGVMGPERSPLPKTFPTSQKGQQRGVVVLAQGEGGMSHHLP